MINKAIKEAEAMGPQPALAGGVIGIDDTINMNLMKREVENPGAGSGMPGMGGTGRGPTKREMEISSQRQYVNKN